MNEKPKSDWDINPLDVNTVKNFVSFFKQVLLQNEPFKITITRKSKRTLPQNRSIHKYLTMLADDLNAIGLTACIESEILKAPIEVDWTLEMTKKIWHQVQSTMYPDKPVSTAELEKKQVSAVYDVINRAMIQKTNGAINTPFPSHDTKS